VIAVAAGDPDCRLWLLDAKGGVEFSRWREHAEGFATNLDDGLAVLRELKRVMMERLEDLTAARAVKVTRGRWPLHVLVIDELHEFTVGVGKSKARHDEFNDLLRSLIALGRAPGISVIAATQKPTVDVVPSVVRANFPCAIAFRCRDSYSSDTILGQGMAHNGFDASTIGEPGGAWLMGESTNPVRMRTFNLSRRRTRRRSLPVDPCRTHRQGNRKRPVT